MNDVIEAEPAKPRIVRPRDAASLILLRGDGARLELLAGRRPDNVKFMPGMWVFPGGAIDPEDRRPWRLEESADRLPPRLRSSARAALRETWEEVGVLVGSRAPAAAAATSPCLSPIEAAYAERGIAAAFDGLTYVGRAITPTRAFRRFNTRFFLADGEAVFGEPVSTDELEEVGWHPIGRRQLAPTADVTHFMLARAIAMRAGTAPADAPLFCTVGRRRRILVCREAIRHL